MRLEPVQIGGFTSRNNVFLAPLAGYTNYPMRKLCASFGAGLCFTEMVSAKGLKYGSENTKELLYTSKAEGMTAAQIFGNEPDTMRAACENIALEPFPIVDINMGCPVPKIYKNGEGSALLENPLLAALSLATVPVFFLIILNPYFYFLSALHLELFCKLYKKLF